MEDRPLFRSHILCRIFYLVPDYQRTVRTTRSRRFLVEAALVGETTGLGSGNLFHFRARSRGSRMTRWMTTDSSGSADGRSRNGIISNYSPIMNAILARLDVLHGQNRGQSWLLPRVATGQSLDSHRHQHPHPHPSLEESPAVCRTNGLREGRGYRDAAPRQGGDYSMGDYK